MRVNQFPCHNEDMYTRGVIIGIDSELTHTNVSKRVNIHACKFGKSHRGIFILDCTVASSLIVSHSLTFIFLRLQIIKKC